MEARRQQQQVRGGGIEDSRHRGMQGAPIANGQAQPDSPGVVDKIKGFFICGKPNVRQPEERKN